MADDYIPIVQKFLPLCKGKPLAARCEMLMLRDQASDSLKVANDDSAPILAQVEWLVSKYGFARIPTTQLLSISAQIRYLSEAANMLQLVGSAL